MFWKAVYDTYVKGRSLGKLKFENHGAHKACTTARQYGMLAAWREALADHAKGGNPYLPPGVKTGLGFAGGFLLVILGIIEPKQRWVIRTFTFLTIVLLSQTFWEGSQAPEGNKLSTGLQNYLRRNAERNVETIAKTLNPDWEGSQDEDYANKAGSVFSSAS
jgi:hypothetical protein